MYSYVNSSHGGYRHYGNPGYGNRNGQTIEVIEVRGKHHKGKHHHNKHYAQDPYGRHPRFYDQNVRHKHCNIL